MTLFGDFWGILTPKQRRGILTMQIVSMAMAFSTVSGIAAIAPFFAVLGQPELIDRNALLHWAYAHGGFSSKRGFVVALGIAFIVVMLIANLINVLGSLAMSRMALRIGTELQSTLFGEYLSRPYAFHTRANGPAGVFHVSLRGHRLGCCGRTSRGRERAHIGCEARQHRRRRLGPVEFFGDQSMNKSLQSWRSPRLRDFERGLGPAKIGNRPRIVDVVAPLRAEHERGHIGRAGGARESW